jgi:hypothetical protein
MISTRAHIDAARPRRWTCESRIALDLCYLSAHGLLHPDARCVLHWSQRDEEIASAVCEAFPDHLELRYTPVGQTNWPIRHRIDLSFTRQKLGGRRRWLVCPTCGARRSALYGPTFRCRECLGLRYESQRQQPWWRALGQSQKFRAKLGSSSGLEPIPSRPKRMHHRTYERLVQQAEEWEAVLDEWTDVLLQRSG